MNNDLDRAIALHKMGKLDEAEKLYLRIIETDKNNFTILQLLGTLYLQKKNFNLSEKFLLKSLKYDQLNPGTINNLGILKKNTNDFEKALEYFELI